jgi:hypothetical protein
MDEQQKQQDRQKKIVDMLAHQTPEQLAQRILDLEGQQPQQTQQEPSAPPKTEPKAPSSTQLQDNQERHKTIDATLDQDEGDDDAVAKPKQKAHTRR